MRHFVLLLLLCIASSMAMHAQTDTLTVSFDGKEVPLNRALFQLRKKYKVAIAYDNRALKEYKVSSNGNPIPLSDLLKSWLEPNGYTYEYLAATLVVFPKLIEEEPVGNATRFNFVLHGKILDAETNEPLPFASVSEAKTGRGAYTNEQGYFTLNEVSSDTVVLNCSYIGYKSRMIRLTPADDVANYNIFLRKSRALLPTATVISELPSILETTKRPSLQTMNVDLAMRLPNTGEPDIVRSLQLLPGVSGALENSSALHVRGGASDENLVLYDGFTIYYLDHFYGVFSAFNTNSIKNVRLHRGVFEPKFGGRASSILEITGKQGNLNETNVKLDLNFMSASVHLESPILGERASMVLSMRRSYTDLVFSPLYRQLFNGVYNNSVLPSQSTDVNAFGGDEQPDFHFYDVTAKIGITTDNDDRLSFSFYTGKDQLSIGYGEASIDQRFDIEYNDRSSWGNDGLGATWSREWDAIQRSNLTIGYSAYNSELFGFDSRTNLFLGTTDTLFFDRNTTIQDVSIRFNHDLRLRKNLTSFGFAMTNYQVVNGLLESTGIDQEEIDLQSQADLYVQNVWTPTLLMSVTGGIRAAFFTGTNKAYIEPRIISAYRLNEYMTLNAALGRNHQFIRNIRRQDLFLNTSDEWRLVDADRIPVLRSDQFSLGLSYERERFSIGIEAYQKWSDGTVQDALQFSSKDAGTYDGDIVTGTGIARGLELLISKTKGKHAGWVAYTLSKAENQFDEITLEESIPAEFDRRNEFKAVYTYRPGRLHFNAVFVYASGLPYTPAFGTYELELLNGEIREFVAFGQLNSGRLPDYHRLDLSVYYDFQLGIGNATVGLSVYNTYNRNNIKDRYYYVAGTEGDDLFVSQRDQAFLGFLPALQLSVEW